MQWSGSNRNHTPMSPCLALNVTAVFFHQGLDEAKVSFIASPVQWSPAPPIPGKFWISSLGYQLESSTEVSPLTCRHKLPLHSPWYCSAGSTHVFGDRCKEVGWLARLSSCLFTQSSYSTISTSRDKEKHTWVHYTVTVCMCSRAHSTPHGVVTKLPYSGRGSQLHVTSYPCT